MAFSCVPLNLVNPKKCCRAWCKSTFFPDLEGDVFLGAFFKEGNFERAAYHFSLSLEEDENEEAYFYLGLISNHIKKIREALSYFYKSIQKNPEYGNPCNEIGVILLRHGREKEAVYWLKKSTRCRINDARHVAYYNLS